MSHEVHEKQYSLGSVCLRNYELEKLLEVNTKIETN